MAKNSGGIPSLLRVRVSMISVASPVSTFSTMNSRKMLPVGHPSHTTPTTMVTFDTSDHASIVRLPGSPALTLVPAVTSTEVNGPGGHR